MNLWWSRGGECDGMWSFTTMGDTFSSILHTERFRVLAGKQGWWGCAASSLSICSFISFLPLRFCQCRMHSAALLVFLLACSCLWHDEPGCHVILPCLITCCLLPLPTMLPFDKIVVVLLTCLFYMCMSSSSYVKRTWERTVLKCHNLDWQNWTAMFQSPAPVQNWTRLSSHSSRSADFVCVFDVPACLCEFICKPFLSVRKIQNVSSAIGYWLLFSSTNVWQVNQV